jgi:hypothetical protein
MLRTIVSLLGRVRAVAADRRRHHRRKSQRAARLMFNVSVAGSGGERTVPVQGHTLDISEDGLALVVDSLRIGDNLLTDPDCTLRIVLLDIPSGQVAIQAMPVRYEQLDTPFEQHLIGVEIKHMDDSDRYRFISFLNTLR